MPGPFYVKPARHLRRFIRSRRDRYQVYRSTNGMCAYCMCLLEGDWEVDHICRWADGGTSAWYNLQPLCKSCHHQKTAQENTMNGPLRLKSWGTQENGDGPLRRGHRDGCLIACERFSQGERFTSVILPTRYGKSHLARFLTVAACFGIETPNGVIHPFASCGLFLTHRGFLSRQIIDGKKWKEFYRLFQIENAPSVMATQIARSPDRPQNICSNGEQFAVATIPMISNNIEVFADWVEWKAQHSKPPVVFADEAQFFGDGDDKKWGPALLRLAEAGAFVMPMTATPMRADGELIPGFKRLGAISSDERAYKSEDAGFVHPELGVCLDDEGKPIRWTKVETYARSLTSAQLDAHVTVQRQEAWFHKYLCRLQRIRVRVRMSDGNLLEELSRNKQRQMLGKVVRDKDVMQELFNHAEESLKELRQKVLRNAGGIVFVDSTREGDNHGRQVERMIRGLKRTPILATMDGDGEIQDAIDRFVEGEGDYLIVKNSAGAGLDAARIKVVVDLSSVRQFASCEQRWNRAGTPTNGMNGSRITVATLITPGDVFSDEIFEDIYTKQGGECRETTDELLETIYKPKKERPPTHPLFVDGVDTHDIRDTGGLVAEAEEVDDAKLFIEIAGKASGFNLGNITVPEGANFLKLWNQAKDSKEDSGDDHLGGFEETTTKIGNARAFNHKAACELARIVHGNVNSETMRIAWSSIYVEANRILSTRPSDKHYITSKVYRNTTDMQVLDVVRSAIQHLTVRPAIQSAQ
jgi:superfamily II DNA or RNA helicase